MNRLSREEYVQKYKKLGENMFENCTIPTVYDFINAYQNKDTAALSKIEQITQYTGNTADITKSVNRRQCNYGDDESNKFMSSVIAANVSDITESGFFYKKLISSCDNMKIDAEDCGSEGAVITLPIDKSTFDYKVKDHWITELNKYVEDFDEIENLEGEVHVRSFLTCNCEPRHFCKKCAGIYRRSYDTEFTPLNIGSYATYMITEHATQASLDSMNKGESGKINSKLEQHIKDCLANKEDQETDQFTEVDEETEIIPNRVKIKTFEQAKAAIAEIIDSIGNVGVESRFYEIALLSRWRDGKFVSLNTSMSRQPDRLGLFIWSATDATFKKLLTPGTFEANSLKTRIAFDRYEEQ